MVENSLFVIDDEPAICTLIQRIAEGCGYPVAVTSDPAVFKQQFRAVAPNVICLDLAMPGSDGIEVLRFLAAQGCQARVLVISGYQSAMVQMAVRLGEALGLEIARGPVQANPDCRAAQPVAAARLPASNRSAGRRVGGQRQRSRGARARNAVELERPAVQFGKQAGERQAEARPVEAAGEIVLELHER